MTPALTRQRLLLWLAIAATIFAVYWLCLRYFFPGYYAPVSAFDSDFYDYTSLRNKTLIQILRFPRPAAYFTMKVLGQGGVQWVITNGIVLALVNIWLTIFLVNQISCTRLRDLAFATAVYTLLLFAHPDFYFEHRHDLPAQASYFFGIISLICWNNFLAQRKWLSLCASLLAAILFVFSKETYFISFLVLAIGMLLINRATWKKDTAYIAVLLALELTSVLWNAHLNGPFVNANAAANNAYRIDLSAASLTGTTWFYLRHFVNPFSIAIVAWAIFLLRKQRRLLVLSATFVLAGIAALAPHAILPNHLLEEYAWVGVPLFFAPVLLMSGNVAPQGLTLLLLPLALFGYRVNYQSPELTFNVQADKVGRPLMYSIPKLHLIPEGSRVLIAGLDATYIPFSVESFLWTEFGDKTSWTLLTGPAIQPRTANRFTRVIGIQEAQLDSYNLLVSYNSAGDLLSIRKTGDIPPSERAQPSLLVPELRPYAELAEKYPEDAYRKYLAANVCLNWGLLNVAEHYINEAATKGGTTDPTYVQLSFRLAQLRRESSIAANESVSFTARPQYLIDTDGSGLGVTELVWTISPPRPCEIHVNAPGGKLFSTTSGSGRAKTDKWVRDGMVFYLQDVSGGKPLTPENTLAQVTLQVSKQ